MRGQIQQAVKWTAAAADALRRPRGLVILIYHRVGARTPVSVDLPTLKAELGTNWQIAAWRVIAAPKGISADVQRTLVGALKKVYDSKDYKDFMASRGFGVVWADPQDTAKFMAASDTNLGAALKAVGLAK